MKTMLLLLLRLARMKKSLNFESIPIDGLSEVGYLNKRHNIYSSFTFLPSSVTLGIVRNQAIFYKYVQPQRQGTSLATVPSPGLPELGNPIKKDSM